MVKINGVEYSVRSLTLPEVRKATALGTDEADVACIAWATGCPLLEVKEWFDRVSMGAAQAVINAVLEAAALTEDAQFPDPAGHASVDARA